MASYWLAPQLMENQIQQYILDANPAQTITLVEEEDFSPQLQQALSKSDNFQLAMEDLYRVWGVKASVVGAIMSPRR